jgi:hypothetical protein
LPAAQLLPRVLHWCSRCSLYCWVVFRRMLFLSPLLLCSYLFPPCPAAEPSCSPLPAVRSCRAAFPAADPSRLAPAALRCCGIIITAASATAQIHCSRSLIDVAVSPSVACRRLFHQAEQQCHRRGHQHGGAPGCGAQVGTGILLNNDFSATGVRWLSAFARSALQCAS